MNYVRHEHILSDSKDIPDEQVFVVYREKDNMWAFAFKVRGRFTLSQFQPDNANKEKVKHSQKQIMFCKTYGWSYTGQRLMNDDSFQVDPLFMCMYCQNTSFDTSKPCVCRNKSTESLLKKTDSGIILSI